MVRTSLGRRIGLTLLFGLIMAPPAVRAERLPLSAEFEVPGVSYAPQIPLPSEIIGHRIGERHTRPGQVVDYFEEIARSSDRVLLARHGETYEGRPLIHAFVSSPSNLARLEQVRRRNLELSDRPSEISDGEIARMPAIVYMGYSIHGNEASGTEAALLLLYHLAAGKGRTVDAVLERTVVIIDPMLNPDGRGRFVSWVNGNRGRVATTDPSDREHTEPWPGGRTNHYWFDLNRDWLPAQLVESQGRLELYHSWRPQLLTDHHEMGSDSTFFFQPGVPSRDNPNTPKRTIELTGRIARYHARALDRIASLYYSEENYDDFYFGKGSTYPDINGAVGILFEQASSRALRRETESGILDYALTVRNHLAASLSTLEAAVDLREELLKNQRDFYREAAQIAAENPIKAYLVKADSSKRFIPLAEILRRHQIQVFQLKEDVTEGGIEFEKDRDLIIPTAQRQNRLLKTLMEVVTEFNDSVFYDISSWSLPASLGVQVMELRRPAEAFIGGGFEAGDFQPPPLESSAGYAYLMAWDHLHAPRALYRLLEAGLQVRLLKDDVELNEGGTARKFPRSTLVIPTRQPGVPADRVHQLMKSVAVEDHVEVTAVSTGLTDAGPDLGGPSAHPLEKPRVLLLAGPGASSSRIGPTWFVLNERNGIPVSLVDPGDFDEIDLSRYNRIVFAGSVPRAIRDDEVDRLKKWIHRGGVFIATHSAAGWALRRGIVQGELRNPPHDERHLNYEEVADYRRSQSIPGTIFAVKIDHSHPVAYGYPEKGSVFRDYETILEPHKYPGANVVLYTDSKPISGYAPPDGPTTVLPGSAAVIARPVRSGAVILFADDPNFRAFWYATSGMFLNALFFGSAF